MRCIFRSAIVFSLIFSGVNAAEVATSNDEIASNDKNAMIGYGVEDALENSMAISMLGWGVGSAIAIAVLAAVIKPSSKSDDTSSTAHAHAHSN